MKPRKPARPADYFDIYAAQLGVLGREGQMRLRQARVHVAGTGGLGSQVLLNLAAVGVRHLTANDPQRLDLDNLNRFPTATLAAVGRPKIELMESLLHGRPSLTFEGIVARNEDSRTAPFFEAADLIVCSSNTVESRIEAAVKAIRIRTPLLDVAVADGRNALVGSIRLYLPQHCSWSACPACYFQPGFRPTRHEALLFTLLAATAAFASHLAVRLMCQTNLLANLFVLDLSEPRLAAFSVSKRDGCDVCGRSGMSTKIGLSATT